MNTTINAALIALDGCPVGKLEATGRAYRYSYFEEYEHSSNAIPISLCYPLCTMPFEYSFAGELPPYFEHLLPEGWLKEIAESSHLPMETAIEKLATLCRENLGAVEVYGLQDGSSLSFSEAEQFIKDANATLEEKVPLFTTSDHPTSKTAWSHCVRCHSTLPSKGSLFSIFSIHLIMPFVYASNITKIITSCNLRWNRLREISTQYCFETRTKLFNFPKIICHKHPYAKFCCRVHTRGFFFHFFPLRHSSMIFKP